MVPETSMAPGVPTDNLDAFLRGGMSHVPANTSTSLHSTAQHSTAPHHSLAPRFPGPERALPCTEDVGTDKVQFVYFLFCGLRTCRVPPNTIVEGHPAADCNGVFPGTCNYALPLIWSPSGFRLPSRQSI
ncbi:UNVERIFIED_CONTAM: hypothetical protein FKN15_019683 [Acipenser sinensis]